MRNGMRGLFFTVGLFALLQGTICLGVEELTLNDAAATALPSLVADGRTLHVPVWAGTTLAATGLVTLAYAVALPKKRRAA